MTATSSADVAQIEARLHRMVRRWPEVSGYHLNPDADIVAGIVRALTRSSVAYGVPYCPCRDLTGDAEADRANICPCQHHHREIQVDGYCKCVLFVGDNYDPEVAYRPRTGTERMTTASSVRERSVTVYLTQWCAHSRRVKRLLQERGFPFTEIDIDRDPQAAALVESWNRGYRSVPTIVTRLILTEPSVTELASILLTPGAALMPCTVYVTAWCSHSRRVLAWLREQGLDANVVDIERDSAAAEKVKRWNRGFMSVPTLDVTLRQTEPATENLERAIGAIVR
ncbi:MAG: hypothetical protein FJZ90_18075 [Chloroflexi bacterium]|nr:hypothetical protein [Chloroflexota bacterium]